MYAALGKISLSLYRQNSVPLTLRQTEDPSCNLSLKGVLHKAQFQTSLISSQIQWNPSDFVVVEVWHSALQHWIYTVNDKHVHAHEKCFFKNIFKFIQENSRVCFSESIFQMSLQEKWKLLQQFGLKQFGHQERSCSWLNLSRSGHWDQLINITLSLLRKFKSWKDFRDLNMTLLYY